MVQSLDNIAYVLGALTAGGGTMGYVRTGSVPSIAAGCTVGLLCMYPWLPIFPPPRGDARSHLANT